MDRQIRKHLKNRGKESTQRFVALPYNLLESEAWKEISPNAALMYVELKRRYNGANNGNITLSYREAAKAGRCGIGTAKRKLEELQRCGFVKIANKGCYQNRHATTWILTCQVYQGQTPSMEWKHYRKNNSQYL